MGPTSFETLQKLEDEAYTDAEAGLKHPLAIEQLQTGLVGFRAGMMSCTLQLDTRVFEGGSSWTLPGQEQTQTRGLGAPLILIGGSLSERRALHFAPCYTLLHTLKCNDFTLVLPLTCRRNGLTFAKTSWYKISGFQRICSFTCDLSWSDFNMSSRALLARPEGHEIRGRNAILRRAIRTTANTVEEQASWLGRTYPLRRKVHITDSR